MNITIKKLETDEEIRGKAFVAFTAWHEAYTGLIRQDYLDTITLERCEEIAFAKTDGFLIAKDGGRVVGFVGFGDDPKDETCGEIICLYVLPQYYGQGVGAKLLEAALHELNSKPKIFLWVLKENKRAIRFYQKCGFEPNGQEMFHERRQTAEICMVWRRG